MLNVKLETELQEMGYVDGGHAGYLAIDDPVDRMIRQNRC